MQHSAREEPDGARRHADPEDAHGALVDQAGQVGPVVAEELVRLRPVVDLRLPSGPGRGSRWTRCRRDVDEKVEKEPARVVEVRRLLVPPTSVEEGHLAHGPLLLVVGAPRHVGVALGEHLDERAELAHAGADAGEQEALLVRQLDLGRVAQVSKEHARREER